jgi:hypothetical protein
MCGEPPGLEGGVENIYTAYFENDYGEQLVFQHNRKTKESVLWHGDVGWQESHPAKAFMPSSEVLEAFKNMRIKVLEEALSDQKKGFILSEEEWVWLRLVYAVATREPLER